MPGLVRWKDNTKIKFHDAVKIILGKDKMETLGGKCHDFSVSMCYGENVSCSYLGNTVLFNAFDISYSTKDELGKENTVTTRLIIYTIDDGDVFYIGNSIGFRRILRLLLGYKGRGEIETKGFSISADMLIWLVYKAYYSDDEKEIKPYQKLELEKIIGIKGTTVDDVNRVSADGETVLKLLSTLSFILESNAYQSANVQLSYGRHNKLQIQLSVGEKVSVNTTRYYGDYGIGKSYEREDKISILVFIEILPLLKKWYDTEVDSNEWGDNIYIKFLEMIGDEVKKRIDDKIKKQNFAIPKH